MIVVVDASVAAKWFLAEQHRANARRLLAEDIDCVAPDWVLQEVAHAAFKRWRDGEIGEDQAREAVSMLPAYFAELDLSAEFTEHAFEIALSLRHPVYDCLYLACAEARLAPLVTDDRALFAATRDTDYRELVRLLGETDLA